MKFKKVYLEISNICNLSCRFCIGTKREPRVMSPDEFSDLAQKLRGYTEYLYLHLMGEPLCHPHLKSILEITEQLKFKVIITTNGTLLKKNSELLLNSPVLHKVNISLHAFEANDLAVGFDEYLDGCFSFAKLAEGKKIVVLRLWNNGGENELNNIIIEKLKGYFGGEPVKEKHGIRIGERVYIENGDKFDWPDLNASTKNAPTFCYALRDQIGVLCDGTVVPCCLDHEGDMALGNLFDKDLESIIYSPKATEIYNGFEKGRAVEELCKKCGYAQRFSRKSK